jgi:hypothetical protein
MTGRPLDNAATHRAPRLWLAAENGEQLPAPAQWLPPLEGPELPLEIEFEGLTHQEQRAALSAFPGGRRFILVADNPGRRP